MLKGGTQTTIWFWLTEYGALGTKSATPALVTNKFSKAHLVLPFCHHRRVACGNFGPQLYSKILSSSPNDDDEFHSIFQVDSDTDSTASVIL